MDDVMNEHLTSKNNILIVTHQVVCNAILKIASKELSDIVLRDQFLKNLIFHSKILSETSVQIDDLINISDIREDDLSSDSSVIYNNGLVFDYCVGCGQENIKKNIECSFCSTNLSRSYYE